MKTLFAGLVLSLIFAVCPAPTSADVVKRSYPVSKADIRNPERGFWRFVSEDFAAVESGELADLEADGLTLGYGVVRLDAFRDKPLNAKLLRALDKAFERARKYGVKIILRFAYNYPADEFEYRNAKDAPLGVALGHIEQLKPLLQANADAIAVLQAGFIGAWGEGHSSSNKLDRPENKAKIRDALLDALPKERMLQWRYPPDVMEWKPKPPQPGELVRIGLHNDCFLSSKTDVGTYSGSPEIRARQKAYVAKLTRATLYGGETCDVDSGAERTSCAAILDEGARFHLTTLNRDYDREFMDAWRDKGCFGEVSRSMGYRLVLTDAEAPEGVRGGGSAKIVLRIRNEGWARLYNPRPLKLVLIHRETKRRFDATGAGDIRSVEPESEGSTEFAFEWSVPQDAPQGRYDLDVALPDPAPRLADDPRYAVRFAGGSGEGFGWDGETGRFRLGLTVTVRTD